MVLGCGRRWSAPAVWLILGAATCGLSGPHARTRPSAGKPGNVKPFARGVRIDWDAHRVEVDAAVVLRKGPLELIACTPGTKEHESILVVKASATHIYQALGLIGLESGKPARFDERLQRMLPPEGQRLSVRVRFRGKEGLTTVPVERWLLHASNGKPVEDVAWVFAGSRALGGGSLGADLEGTVLCVVDFDTALMAVGALHTSNNEALWVVANADRIPPLKTRCTLLIGAAARPVTITVDASARFLFEGAPISIKRIGAMLAAAKGSMGTLVVVAPAGVSDEVLADAIGSLVRSGIKRERISIQRRSSPNPRR